MDCNRRSGGRRGENKQLDRVEEKKKTSKTWPFKFFYGRRPGGREDERNERGKSVLGRRSVCIFLFKGNEGLVRGRGGGRKNGGVGVGE